MSSRYPVIIASLLFCAGLSGCASSGQYQPETDPVAHWLAEQHPQALTVYLSERQAEQEGGGMPWRAAFSTGAAMLAYHNPILGLSSSASALLAMTNAPHLFSPEEIASPADSGQWIAMMMSMQGSQQLQLRVHELEAALEARLASLDQQVATSLTALPSGLPQGLDEAIAERLDRSLEDVSLSDSAQRHLRSLTVAEYANLNSPLADITEALFTSRTTAGR